MGSSGLEMTHFPLGIKLALLASVHIIIHNIKPYKLHWIACIRMIFYSIGGIFQIKRE